MLILLLLIVCVPALVAQCRVLGSHSGGTAVTKRSLMNRSLGFGLLRGVSQMIVPNVGSVLQLISPRNTAVAGVHCISLFSL